ncbi:MAG: Eco57I restriction-modification methylase domain-containing protein [Cyclobacteriaceae bacterium]
MKKSLAKSLNKAYRRQKVLKTSIEVFRDQLHKLLHELDESESEEHVKNDMITFLNETWYKDQHRINTKGKTDLVIHQDNSPKSSAAVLLEVKKPSNKSEMISRKQLNAKALQELLLYYLRERIQEGNKDIRHLIVTNVYEWFIFDASEFYRHFYSNKKLEKAYREWVAGQKDSSSTDLFYKDIATPIIDEVKDQLSYTWFDLREYEKELDNTADSRNLISLYKLLSPVHLLKLPFANDSNSLNKQFYHELLHIIGLEEVKDKSKKVIRRKEKGKRNDGSLLENAMMIMDERDRIRMLDKPSQFGKTNTDQLYNVGLELCITWINRILFLKLLESQLVAYHKKDKHYRFLDITTVPNYDALASLFFGVLAKKFEERNDRYREKYARVPYLNSSLFEPTGLEELLEITQLNNDLMLDIYPQSVLKSEKGKRLTGQKDTLTYLFEFLEAYDFSSEGQEDIQEENKTLINASVLGLIFEKINGYKDGSFYTPGFITMYMCRETIRRAVVQKFNEVKGWSLDSFDQLHDRIDRDDKQGANEIINSLKICDPAVGSGHFLVSALNEIITIKSELKILLDRNGKTLRDYDISIENDELIVEAEGELFDYVVGNKEKQRVQETLFHEKQTIIENCLFGIDINANSVKICRLRLWIELLKNAYYKNATELETLPNIDINIKTGNSLISRFGLDSDIKQALRGSKWNIGTYKTAVHSYKNATAKDDKREFERLIKSITADFKSKIDTPLKKELKKARGQLDQQLTDLNTKKQWGEKIPVELRNKVKKAEEKLLKLIDNRDEIESNKLYENAFEWRFQFPEVLDDEGNFTGFDIVIGNPPYIRQEELVEIKPYLSEQYSIFTGTADMYVYFVELGMKLLRDKGVFTFIVPNKWMRAGYGKKLRSFVKSYEIHELLDFGDLPVFEEATTYPLIMELSKSTPTAEFRAVNFTSLDFDKTMDEHIQTNSLEVLTEELAEHGWTLTDSKVQKLLAKLKSKGQPLGEFVDGKIFRGVLTGLNEAFVIDNAKRQELIAADPASTEVIKPFLAGRDIKRYQQPKSDKYLIFTRRGISIEKYPAILKHLKKYKARLEPKPKSHQGVWEGRKPGTYKWYEIQDAVDYFEEFEKEKILYQEIATFSSFTLDSEQFFANNKIFMITGVDERLLGWLNSKLVWFYLSNVTSKLRGDAFAMQSPYIMSIPLNDSVLSNQRLIALSNNILEGKKNSDPTDTSPLEKQIDQLVYELYGLTEEEIKIVEGGVR